MRLSLSVLRQLVKIETKLLDISRITLQSKKLTGNFIGHSCECLIR